MRARPSPRAPGLIDVHVHIGWHFDKDGRADNQAG
jgi:imidazolonepropionase-like amidohydrolase